jgi:hypothetical protein
MSVSPAAASADALLQSVEVTEAGIRAAMDRLEKEKCECVTCGECNGKGYIVYSGSRFAFDDDTEPCDCSGGISQVCERCCELRDLDEDLKALPR